MALVTYVFASVLMLSEGLRATLVASGSADNVVLLRQGSQSEVQSSVDRKEAAVVESMAGIATDRSGGKLLAKEALVLITLPKKDGGISNVTIRGTARVGWQLRPQVRLTAGRMFQPGTSEIVVGQSIARRFAGAALGESLRFGGREWRVVGIFDAGRTAFASEIWADAEQILQAFRRGAYSSLLARLADPGRFAAFRDTLTDDPRLRLDAHIEPQFYADQSKMMATFIDVLGTSLSLIFAIGAVVGAAITMYASVANRVKEIGTLRALGFPRRGILLAFLAESLALGLLGGLLGLAAASMMQAVSLSTLNWQTFAEIAFSFTLTPAIAAESLTFAAGMGLVGGLLPALRAARMPIVEALR